MEKRVEEDQKRLELVEETELLEDLCHPLVRPSFDLSTAAVA